MIRRVRTALLAAALVVPPGGLAAQAYAVSSTDSVTQEQQPSAIPAEDQATKEQLTRLFDVMRIRDQMQSMRRMIPTMVETQVRQQIQAMSAQIAPGSKITPAQRTQLDLLLGKYIEKAMDMYPAEEMIADMAALYQEHFSREDVDAMITFYGSPAGQHLLDAQPQIAQEYMPLVMRRTAERTKTLTAEMMKDVAALKQSTRQPHPASNK